jgi:hypothetical protein
VRFYTARRWVAREVGRGQRLEVRVQGSGPLFFVLGGRWRGETTLSVSSMVIYGVLVSSMCHLWCFAMSSMVNEIVIYGGPNVIYGRGPSLDAATARSCAGTDGGKSGHAGWVCHDRHIGFIPVEGRIGRGKHHLAHERSVGEGSRP